MIPKIKLTFVEENYVIDGILRKKKKNSALVSINTRKNSMNLKIDNRVLK